MVRSSAGPALSRIRAEWTRPSVPIMKLTLTLALESAVSSNGFGVAKGSGGREASQSLPALGRSIAANFESRSGEDHIRRSRTAKFEDVGCARSPRPELAVEARQLAETTATRRSEHNLRTCMSQNSGSYRAIRMPAVTTSISLILNYLDRHTNR